VSTLQPLFEKTPLVALYHQALMTDQSVNAEIHIARSDGRAGWADVNVINVDRDVIAIVGTDITDAVESREALGQERARLASLIAGSSDLACVVDRSGAVIYAPPWEASFLGFTTAELGAPLSKVAPGDLDEAAAWFAEVGSLASGTTARSVVLRFVARNGSVHTCDVGAENRSDEPAVGGIVLNAHDATALVAAEAQLAAVADAVSDVIVITDADGLVMWASDAVRRELGLDPEQVIGTLATNIVHPDDRVVVADGYVDLVNETFAASPLNVRLRRADGKYRWFEATGSNRLADPSIRGLVISMRDISERRAAEAALRVSEERNRSILEAAADAIISVDTDGIIQTFNRAAELIFGVPAGRVIGEFFGGFLAPDALGAVLTSLDGGQRSAQIETLATRADGERFAAHIAISDVQVGETHYYTAVLRDVSDQRAMELALRTAASCDDLTGLPNRRALLARAQDAIDLARVSDGVVGMVFIDLDRFKLVNDGLGHDAGDELLVLVAERIAGAIRSGDVVARLGSDEFAVLCPSADDLDAIKTVAVRIVDAIGGSFIIAENEVFIGASIGVSVSTGQETPLELLRFADTAMYRAKARGNPGVEVFDSGMENNAARRLGLESALRQATRRGELVMYYQPIVDLDDGRTTYLEALVRWDRPGVGLVLPDMFIPVAEETGIIMDIGPWVLRRAVDDCRLWQETAPGVGVSVNVSVRQVESGVLVDAVRAALLESDLDPDLLTIEITESVMLEHSDRNAGIMRRIRDLGVHMSLDDFGTGYSSLTYLRRLPIDSIKIDRSFLQSLGSALRDDAMLHAIVELGAAHDLVVVAEGIDTDAKLALVRSVGCHRGQGFLFSKPMPFAQAVAYLGLDQTRAWTTSR
jgi:diguanylate cyclase (GGDEF)-like protein/PAS domain S-box-containing protein